MKRARRVAIVTATLALLGAGSPTTALRGFSAAQAAAERAVEAQFLDIPSASAELDAAAAFGGQTEPVGSGADHARAVAMRDQLRADGLTAELESHRAEVDTPRTIALALAPPAALATIEPPRRGHDTAAAFPITLDLHDRGAVAGDGPSDGDLPFDPGSADGDVRAPLVFAGRGLDADYATLAGAKVDVRGAIVLLRTAGQRAAALARRAQARGAAGVLLYADPDDAGAERGAPYPAGPWRRPDRVDRSWLGPGIDIPVLPISADNARILLSSLQGPPGPPPDWSGALPVAYPLARGPGRVHLVVKLDRRSTTAWNVIAVIPGLRDDQTVIVGGRRDTRGFAGGGASSVVTLLEIARGLGYLRASGWQPARTIVIAGWGGDDVGLAGSLAYANRHWLERARRCIAYVSADRAVTGPTFTAGASPALAGLALAATESVPDPAAPTATIFDRWTAQFGRALPRITLAEPAEGESFPAQSGTPIVTMRFSGAFGVADTADDTLAYARRWTDPDFSLHRAAAQLDGIAVLRLADGETVPYVFGGYPQILRDAMNRLAARATANGVSVDLTAFERSVDRLATAAVAVDRRFGLATDPANAVERELRAARELDAVVTDTLADDRSDHADAKPDAAVDRATGAVGRATDDLTF